MVKQPPQLLTRVIRAITALRDPKGSSVKSIIYQVRLALNDANSEIPRNITLQVRRALKHAMDNGLVQVRAGKYRVAGKKRAIPVDSLELAVDYKGKKRRKTAKKSKHSPRRRSSEHDRSKAHRQKRQRRQRHKGKSSHSTRSSSSKHSVVSKGSAKSSSPKQRSATPNASSNSTGGTNNASADKEERQSTPYPDSEREASPAERKRSRQRRQRSKRQSQYKKHSDGPSTGTVDDVPMVEEQAPRMRSMPRNPSPTRRVSMPPQREQVEKDGDEIDEIQDLPPYYN